MSEPSHVENEARDRSRTAYHEAAHAVVAEALGVRVVRLTIIPDPERHTKGSYACDPETLHNHRQQAIISIAGITAEGEALGNAHIGGMVGDSEAFWDAVDFLSAGLSSDERMSLARELEMECRRIVRSRWTAIERLTQVLLEQGQASPEEISGIVRE